MRLDPDDLEVVDELLRESGLAVAEVKAPLAEEAAVVTQRLDGRLLPDPSLVPSPERRRVMQPDILHVIAHQARPLSRLQHSLHTRQVAAGENVAPYEVGAPDGKKLYFMSNRCSPSYPQGCAHRRTRCVDLGFGRGGQRARKQGPKKTKPPRSKLALPMHHKTGYSAGRDE